MSIFDGNPETIGKYRQKPTHRKDSMHPGFRATCQHCGVSAYISEETLLKKLEEGLKSQRLEIVSTADGPPPAPYGLLGPLVKTLRKKGIRVI